MQPINKNVVVGDKVRSMATEILREGNYDICEEFSIEDVAKAAANLAMALVGRGLNRELVLVPTTVSLVALGLTWRANNFNQGSWINVSNTKGTGVGRTLVSIIVDPEAITQDEVEQLVEMMNEAWFLMKSTTEWA